MYVHEIKPGSDITIIASMNGHTGEFATTVLDVIDNCLITKPVYAKDMRINFNTKGLACNVQGPNAEDNRYYEFIKVNISTIKTKDGSYFYKISSLLAGKIINRRGAVRVFVGAFGELYLNPSVPKSISVTVKDISMTGLAFITENDVVLPIGKDVVITFSDSEENVKFTIGVKIVRKADATKDRLLYGCTLLNTESNALAKYINEKQRRNLTRRK